MVQRADLSQAVLECHERWGLTPDGAFPRRYRYVEPVRMPDGAPAVLKLGPPDDREFGFELDALEWFSAGGGVHILAIDRERGAVLMERLLPGTRLLDSDLDDEAVTAVAAGVMAAIWRPGAGFPSVREWGRSLTGRPAAVFAELCDSMGEQVVLHGARIRAWAWAQAHLAAAWSVADGEDPGYFLATAARLEPLMRR